MKPVLERERGREVEGYHYCCGGGVLGQVVQIQAGYMEAQQSEQKAKKRGATHQGNQQCSSVGVGPGQDGSFGLAAAARRQEAAVGQDEFAGVAVETTQEKQQQLAEEEVDHRGWRPTTGLLSLEEQAAGCNAEVDRENPDSVCSHWICASKSQG